MFEHATNELVYLLAYLLTLLHQLTRDRRCHTTINPTHPLTPLTPLDGFVMVSLDGDPRVAARRTMTSGKKI